MSRLTVPGPRCGPLRLASAIVVLALAVAACGGSSSSAPAGSGEPSAAASQEPGGSAGSGGGSEAPADDFSSAAQKLDDLDSYQFSVEMESSSAVGGGTVSAGTNTFSGVVVNKPAAASSLHMISADPAGTVTNDTQIVQIGGDAWMRSGGETTPWQAIPAEQAATFGAIFDAFRPEKMFAVYFGPIGEDSTRIGQEQRNGIDAIHYQGGASVGAILGSIVGVQGSWSSDIWVAVEGGYLVHSEASVQASDANGGGSFSVVVDIKDVNSSSNTVVAPM